MRVAIHTLGCKANQYETQAMETLLRARGHTLVPFEAEADAYVVNSCTVTAVSDRKSRQAVRQARKRGPRAVVALCGCYPQVSPEEAGRLDCDLISGTGDRIAFLDLLEQTAAGRGRTVSLDDPFRRKAFEVLPAGGLAGRTRAMLKAEDGCANFCAYCIIPYARGAVRSLPLEAAEREAARLAGEGYRELVLTGIELSSYGRDLPGRPGPGDQPGLGGRPGPGDLIETVCRAAPDLRVRLGSLEPRTVTEEFCDRLAALPNLCPHFHLSLQSGCDATLARMRRKYDTERYLRSAELLRARFDRPGLTTDLIVGFPGETEEEFQTTLAFLRRCAFSRMHIFPYSRRRGTPAADLPGQVSNAVKADRAARAAELAAAMERSWLTGWIGQSVPVLFEEEKAGFWRGYTPQYMEVRVPAAGQDLHNRIIDVTVTAAGGTAVFGKRKEEP